MRAITNTLLFLIFVLLRTVFDGWTRNQDIWVAYGIESSIALTFIALNFRHIVFRFSLRPTYWRHIIYSAILGVAIATLGMFTGSASPFDFSDPSLWIQLVLIAPLLEEALFRLLAWEAIQPYLRRPRWIILSTALLFSLSHLAALTYVPETYKAFVIYQSCYTFGLGLYWGLVRQRTGSWTAAVALHFVLNLCFGLTHFFVAKYDLAPHRTEASNPRLLIVDMPIGNLAGFENQRSGSPILTLFGPEDGDSSTSTMSNCKVATKNCNGFFESQRSGTAVNLTESELDNVRKLVTLSHGYHMLGIAQQGLSKTEIYTIGMQSPPGADGIKDPKDYIKKSIVGDLERVRVAVEELHPTLVLAATSETIEENYDSLKAAGFKDADAERYASEIFSAWANSWNTLLDTYPNTTFIVPTGNGGLDGVGDDIEEANVMPASLLNRNLVKVASSDGTCLSKFSNYDSILADVAAPGELVASWSACPESPELKLSGTSQAAAIFANRALKAIEQGIRIDEFLKSHIEASPPCLADKVLRGVVN